MPRSDGIELVCPHCHDSFVAPTSMRGGLANCPSCSRAVEVPGAADENAYWLLIGLGALAAIGIAALVAVTASPVAGAITLVVEAAILGMIIAFS